MDVTQVPTLPIATVWRLRTFPGRPICLPMGVRRGWRPKTRQDFRLYLDDDADKAADAGAHAQGGGAPEHDTRHGRPRRRAASLSSYDA